ncbi:carbohydrate-binding protein [Streptomyces sp. SM13]|uniref:carbohydrate-binding protein n=1 Tax=Streptomyces sp. SM13 TaxID=1983803 RepID=UPI0021562C52|nr:carbohydrate-binding protein [Streptomyces sp. SM13]
MFTIEQRVTSVTPSLVEEAAAAPSMHNAQPWKSVHPEGANLYFALNARYVDKGAPDSAALTGYGRAVPQPRHRQAEHFSAQSGTRIVEQSGAELRSDSPAGPLIATTPVPATDGWDDYRMTPAVPLGPVSGTHRLHLVFRTGSGGAFDVDAIQFDEAGPATARTG